MHSLVFTLVWTYLGFNLAVGIVLSLIYLKKETSKDNRELLWLLFFPATGWGTGDSGVIVVQVKTATK